MWNRISPLVLLLAALPAGGLAKDVAFRVSGPSLSDLTVEAVRLQGATATSVPVLVGVELLPLVASGQAPVHDDDPTRPRAVVLGPGVPALRLPDRDGTLVLHYRRGATTFGFAVLDASGRARVLVERSGLTATQTVDPFVPVVGVSPESDLLAVSAPEFKQIGGYGDAWLFALRGAPLAGGVDAIELTGPAVADVEASSLTFFGAELWCVLDDELATMPRDGSTGLQVVTLPPSGGTTTLEVSEEFLLSGDGSTLAFLAGTDEALADLYVADANGIRNVTNAPSELTPPGWRPDETAGPFLAISDDGAAVAFLRELAGEDEVFLQLTAPGSTPVHVTSDALFDTSIDSPAGLLGGGLLRFRLFASSGNQNADLYEAELLPGGGLATKNLTQTSGVAAPVYPNAATLAVETSRRMSGARVIVDDRTAVGQGFDLWHVDAAGNGALIAPGLLAPPAWTSGVPWRYVGRLQMPSNDVIVEVDGGSAPQPMLAPPPGVRFDDVRAGVGGRVVHFVADVGGLDFVGAIHRDTGALELAPGAPYTGAAGLAFTAGGRVLFAADAGGATQTYAVAADGSFTVPVGAAAPVAGWID